KYLHLRRGLLKRVSEDPLQRSECSIVGPDVDWPRSRNIKPSHIVQPHDVIRMRVRKHDGVYAVYLVCYALESQLRRRIYEPAGRTIRDHDRRAGALVPRIEARAHCTAATDHRHTGACARAQEKKLDVHKMSYIRTSHDCESFEIDRRLLRASRL